MTNYYTCNYEFYLEIGKMYYANYELFEKSGRATTELAAKRKETWEYIRSEIVRKGFPTNCTVNSLKERWRKFQAETMQKQSINSAYLKFHAAESLVLKYANKEKKNQKKIGFSDEHLKRKAIAENTPLQYFKEKPSGQEKGEIPGKIRKEFFVKEFHRPVIACNSWAGPPIPKKPRLLIMNTIPTLNAQICKSPTLIQGRSPSPSSSTSNAKDYGNEIVENAVAENIIINQDKVSSSFEIKQEAIETVNNGSNYLNLLLDNAYSSDEQQQVIEYPVENDDKGSSSSALIPEFSSNNDAILLKQNNIHQVEDGFSSSSPWMIPELPSNYDAILKQNNFRQIEEKENGIFGNMGIRGRDLLTLIYPNFLNDTVIDKYLKLLCQFSKIKECYVLETFFFTSLQASNDFKKLSSWIKVDIQKHDYIFIPMHENDLWFLCVLDMKKRNIYIYDSLKRDHDPQFKLLLNFFVYLETKRRLNTEFDTWKTETPNDPIQKGNAVDCGVYLCMHAYHLAMGYKPNINQKGMQIYRKLMIYDLLNGDLSEYKFSPDIDYSRSTQSNSPINLRPSIDEEDRAPSPSSSPISESIKEQTKMTCESPRIDPSQIELINAVTETNSRLISVASTLLETISLQKASVVRQNELQEKILEETLQQLLDKRSQN